MHDYAELNQTLTAAIDDLRAEADKRAAEAAVAVAHTHDRWQAALEIPAYQRRNLDTRELADTHARAVADLDRVRREQLVLAQRPDLLMPVALCWVPAAEVPAEMVGYGAATLGARIAVVAMQVAEG